MQTQLPKQGREASFSVRFKPTSEDFNAFLVVYEADGGEWRGFAYPYGETTDGTSKNEAIESLRVLTDAYYTSIKRYGFPSHLVNGVLNDPMDRAVFKWVVSNKDFMEQIHSKAGKADSEFCYVEAYRGKS